MINALQVLFFFFFSSIYNISWDTNGMEKLARILILKIFLFNNWFGGRFDKKRIGKLWSFELVSSARQGTQWKHFYEMLLEMNWFVPEDSGLKGTLSRNQTDNHLVWNTPVEWMLLSRRRAHLRRDREKMATVFRWALHSVATDEHQLLPWPEGTGGLCPFAPGWDFGWPARWVWLVHLIATHCQSQALEASRTSVQERSSEKMTWGSDGLRINILF